MVSIKEFQLGTDNNLLCNIPVDLQSTNSTDFLTVSIYDKRLNKFSSIQKIPLYKLNITNT